MRETIGQQLKNAREYLHLSLEKAAEVTRIRLQYLQALEADDFSAMPSPVQARGFLRNYAEYLGLDLDQMVAELRKAESKPAETDEVVFEEESTEATGLETAGTAQKPQKSMDEESPPEPFWMQWLKQHRHQPEVQVLEESIKPISENAFSPEPEPVLDQEEEGTLQTEAGPETATETQAELAENNESRSLWISLLAWVKAHLPRRRVPAPPTDVIDDAAPDRDQSEPASVPETALHPSLSSQDIFIEIGGTLRERREKLSLSLEEIERHTHMRANFLKALEDGLFTKLASPVQTRGLLSNYASFLDLDVETILLQFADALQAELRERHPDRLSGERRQAVIPEVIPRLRQFVAGDLVFGVGMLILILGVAIWGISYVNSIRSQEANVQPEPTGPSISEALIGTPVGTIVSEVTLIPVEDTPLPALPEGTLEIPTLATNVNVQMNIVAVERTYLRVLVDGEVVFDGRTIPGNAYAYEAEESIEVLAGNAAALRIIYNQRDLGLLGGFGQLVNYIYTTDEIMTPTPFSPPTSTNTPVITPTPSGTPSPTPTFIPQGDDL